MSKKKVTLCATLFVYGYRESIVSTRHQDHFDSKHRAKTADCINTNIIATALNTAYICPRNIAQSCKLCLRQSFCFPCLSDHRAEPRSLGLFDVVFAALWIFGYLCTLCMIAHPYLALLIAVCEVGEVCTVSRQVGVCIKQVLIDTSLCCARACWLAQHFAQ